MYVLINVYLHLYIHAVATETTIQTNAYKLGLYRYWFFRADNNINY